MVDSEGKTGSKYIEQMSAEAIRECVGGEDVRTWFKELKRICTNGNNSEKIKAIALALKYVAQEPVRRNTLTEEDNDLKIKITRCVIGTQEEISALERLKKEILASGGTEEQIKQRVQEVQI